MKIKMLVMWYGRHDDFTPKYDDDHHGSFYGETPEEIMTQFRDYQNNHDLNKYTPLEIVGIYSC